MSTVPLPAGEVAVIELELLTVNEVALALPNLTAVAPVKLVPVIVTLVPPDVGPVFGLTLVTAGGPTWVNCLASMVLVGPWTEEGARCMVSLLACTWAGR